MCLLIGDISIEFVCLYSWFWYVNLGNIKWYEILKCLLKDNNDNICFKNNYLGFEKDLRVDMINFFI